MPDSAQRTSDTKDGYSYPNKLGRAILTASEEVLGRNGLKAVLAQARLQHRFDAYPPNNFAREFSFEETGRLLRALDEMYGRRKGRSLARRIGQHCFAIGTRDVRFVLFLTRVAFRLLPLETRLRVGLEVTSRVVGRFTGHPVRLSENNSHYYWTTTECGFSWQRNRGSPCCDIVVGLLEETVSWIGRGTGFSVRETACIAAGHGVCTIEIGKQPLD
jgi:hypothetical protein